MHISSQKNRKYVIVPYDKNWADDFEAVKSEIIPVFGDIATQILHVGSTAIVGMSGKPTIDVLVVVRDVKDVDALNPAMAKLGYAALGAYVTSDGRLFAKEEKGTRLVNIHCFEKEHPAAQEMIVMRDFLQSHSDEAKQYADLKNDLYHKFPDDYQEYRRVKDPYLAKMKTRAFEWKSSCS